MRGRIVCLLVFCSVIAYGQKCKSFKLGAFGDTLNCIDMEGLKQGKWVVHVNPLRGNPGYEEEGVFKDDRKEGLWKQFNLMGDKIAEENYKEGNKNGRCFYFTVAGLEREESWKAPTDTKKMYDTIVVQDPKQLNRYEKVIVKTDGRSFRHGLWKYYDPVYGTLKSSEMYMLDVLQENGEDPMKKMKKISDTSSKAGASIGVPKIVASPSFGQKAAKKKSNVQ